jgi:hypothetical protein
MIDYMMEAILLRILDSPDYEFDCSHILPVRKFTSSSPEAKHSIVNHGCEEVDEPFLRPFRAQDFFLAGPVVLAR